MRREHSAKQRFTISEVVLESTGIALPCHPRNLSQRRPIDTALREEIPCGVYELVPSVSAFVQLSPLPLYA